MQSRPELGPNPKWDETENLVVNLQFQYVGKNASSAFGIKIKNIFLNVLEMKFS